MLIPRNTYIALLIVQALHLLHHRLTKRHISFAEVISAFVLVCTLVVADAGIAVNGLAYRFDSCPDNWKRLDKETFS